MVKWGKTESYKKKKGSMYRISWFSLLFKTSIFTGNKEMENHSPNFTAAILMYKD